MEIERKFLVQSQEYRKQAVSSIKITQGFLNTDPERTVRIRIQGEHGYLTIKGISNTSGTMRQEWEFEIELDPAKEILGLCEATTIEKIRYLVNCGSHMFEVDEFQGVNEGLVIAEVELESEDEEYSRPSWLGQEVTGDIKYYNAQLSKTPFKQWAQ